MILIDDCLNHDFIFHILFNSESKQRFFFGLVYLVVNRIKMVCFFAQIYFFLNQKKVLHIKS